jgi:hypothetical protein
MDEVKVLGVRKNPRKPPESSDEEDDDEEVGSNVGSLADAMEEDEDDARHNLQIGQNTRQRKTCVQVIFVSRFSTGTARRKT